MLDFVTTLLESGVISEDTKAEIERAWQARVQENREQVAQELRESLVVELRDSIEQEVKESLTEQVKEFVSIELQESIKNQLREEYAQKYEHDKAEMANAVESFVTDRLQAELLEFAEDRQGFIDARDGYVRRMSRDSKALETFVLQSLHREIAELKEDRQRLVQSIEALETFVVESLSKEIAEFYQDKRELAEAKVRYVSEQRATIQKFEDFVENHKATLISESRGRIQELENDLIETKVRLIKENRERFDNVKRQFIKRTANLVESVVIDGLNKEITQLREDIERAAQNDFGRRIFESFASEFAVCHVNERAEQTKLRKALKEQKEQIERLTKAVAQSKTLVESKEREVAKAREIARRKEIIGELVSPLTADKRRVMKDLLESVSTDRLRSAFDRYLPSVLNNQQMQGKTALVESVTKTVVNTSEVTGDKEPTSGAKTPAEINEIRKLAGLQK